MRIIDNDSFLKKFVSVTVFLVIVFWLFIHIYLVHIYLGKHYASFSIPYRKLIVAKFWYPPIALGSLELICCYTIEFFTKRRYDYYGGLILMVIMDIYFIVIMVSITFFERGREIIDYLIRHFC